MTDDPRSRPARSRSIVAIAVLPAVALLILLLDVVTKTVVVATLDPERPVDIIGDVVQLRLVRNSGAAFSFATGYTWVLTLVAAAVVVGILRFARRLRSSWWAVGLGLVLGGAIGNLVDRLFRAPGPLRGHVVDFVSVGWWPVFNVADSAVVCGAVILVALTVFGVEIDGSRTARHAGSEPAEPDQPVGPAADTDEPADADAPTRESRGNPSARGRSDA